ncbi:MAG: hypothetical protein GXP63_06550 [DPANN group archaeon]|nr:hypothetical protein [DPANN group archaeon]
MHRRKIQLIAGSTYSVSLPKRWVFSQKLEKGKEVLIDEQRDGSLRLFVGQEPQVTPEEITLDIETHRESIDQVLFAIYYVGIRTIHIKHRERIPAEIKQRIRETLRHMSGTEISYEDERSLTITSLLDLSKSDLPQVLFRISLVINLSFTALLEGTDLSEIKTNEREVDRLFHLAMKLISLALLEPSMLASSKIGRNHDAPSYVLIAKKLENVHDLIEDLAETRLPFQKAKKTVLFLQEEFRRTIKHLLRGLGPGFVKADQGLFGRQLVSLRKGKEHALAEGLEEVFNLLVDIQEEIVNLSFYRELREKGIV